MGEAATFTNRGIAYQTVGSGSRIVIALPGIGDTRSSYRRLAPLLAEASCTVHMMDLRGHGESKADFQTYTSEDIGDDVVAFLEEADLDDVTIIGNSVGAAAAVHASLQSARVDRIVSLSGFVSDPPRFAIMRPMLALAFARPWGRTMWRKYRKSLFATLPPDLDQNQIEIYDNLGETGRLRAMRQMMCASKVAIAGRLQEVTVPALIAMGAKDPDFPDPGIEAKRQADLLGGKNQLVMIEGAGHYPQIERPDETACAIVAFIQSTGLHGA
ncbi:MAG: alpha/beta fold hydrolase [Yoonia sp.]|uniref:alpha/beta fold hydrolase n=1 Tax=Yoonia sp. TaxID=2212373 RepID=UPI003EF9D7C6